MALLAAGTVVGYSESEYDMRDVGGQRGTTRKLTVSTGDSTEEIKISQQLADDLGSSGLAKLREFGRPVVCKVTARANKNDRGDVSLGVSLLDIEFVRMADLKPFGYVATVYVEEAEVDGSDPFGSAS